MTPQQLERLLLIAAALGQLNFHEETTAKICRRLAVLAYASDDAALRDLYDELQVILADEGATLLQLAHRLVH